MFPSLFVVVVDLYHSVTFNVVHLCIKRIYIYIFFFSFNLNYTGELAIKKKLNSRFQHIVLKLSNFSWYHMVSKPTSNTRRLVWILYVCWYFPDQFQKSNKHNVIAICLQTEMNICSMPFDVKGMMWLAIFSTIFWYFRDFFSLFAITCVLSISPVVRFYTNTQNM